MGPLSMIQSRRRYRTLLMVAPVLVSVTGCYPRQVGPIETGGFQVLTTAGPTADRGILRVVPRRCVASDPDATALLPLKPTATGDLTLGCANDANLAAMAADPTDLVIGDAHGPAFAAPIAQGVERYLTSDQGPVSPIRPPTPVVTAQSPDAPQTVGTPAPATETAAPANP